MAYEEGVNMNMPVAPAYAGNGMGVTKWAVIPVMTVLPK